MFYPVDSLKRGGRFYLCWVADSWPLRFATITHRQLRSQDIREICDNLLEVMNNESGRPARRFSLRLSSQLMRGLVRLYQRKVTIFLGELCMLNANVTKHVNKKFLYHEEVISAPLTSLPHAVPEIPENEERVEEMIQRSGNVVANIDDITLKESTLPEVQLLLNDNFGEVHPDQPLQLLADKTLEMMMAQDLSAQQQSLEMPHDFSTDKSHDKTRLAPHEPQMERISEHNVTLYRKSAGDELLPILDVTKDIPGIPELLEIPPPVLPDPQPQMKIPEIVMETEEREPTSRDATSGHKEPDEPVLEELEEVQPPPKRRRLKGKIVDKNIKLTSNFLRARIDNCAVELRCENASDDILSIRVPSHILLGRAAHVGPRVGSALGHTLTRLFLRNLGTVNTRPLADREMEEIVAARPRRSHVQSVLEKIDEEMELVLPDIETQLMERARLSREPVISDQIVPPTLAQEDIADLPTQVIETLSHQARKRTGEHDTGTSPKTARRSGYACVRRSQLPQLLPASETALVYEHDKENIPDNIPQEFRQPSTNTARDLVTLTSLLQEAGLADLQPRPAEPDTVSPKPTQKTRKTGSEGTETPLGSLDRTKVSLGDSERTTDSMRFIRDHWGTEGTMVKILRCVKEGTRPLDVRALIASGPILSGLKNIATARCFTSILKLKQHRFINIRKDPDTLEIRDITLGAKFKAM